jgi:hypothetical protein
MALVNIILSNGLVLDRFDLRLLVLFLQVFDAALTRVSDRG